MSRKRCKVSKLEIHGNVGDVGETRLTSSGNLCSDSSAINVVWPKRPGS